MSIGSRIVEARKRKNLTQVELARLLGVSKGAVANYESEYCTPKVEMMYKLFDVLDVDANFLYQDDMATPPESFTLTDEERRLLSSYHAADPSIQAAVRKLLDIPEKSAISNAG